MQALRGDAQLTSNEEKNTNDKDAAAEEKPRRAPRPKAPATAAAAPARAAGGTRARGGRTGGEKATAGKAGAAPREKGKLVVRPPARLQAKYEGEIKGQLFKEFGYKSVMQVPKVNKVTVNIGLGEALTNSKALETAPDQIATITGQKPVITKAKKSVAGFKVREGQSIGVMVTLRGRRMYEFLDRVISLALPRIRDFRGISRTAFDGKGNYSLGLRDQSVFPELEFGQIDRVRGMQIVISTSAQTDPEGFRLLELMGMPFIRQG
jgi:large subunit ribosomal protein L5